MEKDQLRKYLRFINIAFEMGIIIGAGVFIGVWLDQKFPNKFSGFTVSLSLLSVFVALYLVIKRVRDLTRNDN